MKRRTFTQKATTLGLAGMIVPVVPALARSQGDELRELPREISDHLAELENQMLLHVSGTSHQQLIKDYLKPIRIVEMTTSTDGYSFIFRNQLDRTIQLSSSTGKAYSRV